MKINIQNIIDDSLVASGQVSVYDESVMYSDMPGDYYARRMKSCKLNDIWFRERQHITGNLVKKYYSSGVVLDIGCGNCLWNIDGIPTVGLDINQAMLDYNAAHIENFVPLRASIFPCLPVKSVSVDLVVVTKFLEHLPDYPFLIEEIWRVLAPGGTVIASVPYGKLPGLWSLLFPVWCRFKYLKDKDDYYLKKCGHRVDFDFKKLVQAFGKFRYIEKKSLAMLTIFAVVEK